MYIYVYNTLSMFSPPAWLIFLLFLISISISIIPIIATYTWWGAWEHTWSQLCSRKSSISASPSKKEQGCELGNFEKSPHKGSQGLMGAGGPDTLRAFLGRHFEEPFGGPAPCTQEASRCFEMAQNFEDGRM